MFCIRTVKFNILLSCARNLEDGLIVEFHDFLKEIGDENPSLRKSGVSGLVLAYTSLDPFLVVREVRKRVEGDPWYFRYLLKLVPVEKVVKAELDEIKDATKEIIEKIRKDESFKVNVRKRFSDISSRKLIEEVAELLDNPVNLDNPDKIINIEVIGEIAGISVLSPSDIVSIPKIREFH
ncbi:MAG: THUMP domain-containing protein [Candidatus Asgardarchaeia archaeon]